jgi:hypothetical protein
MNKATKIFFGAYVASMVGVRLITARVLEQPEADRGASWRQGVVRASEYVSVRWVVLAALVPRSSSATGNRPFSKSGPFTWASEVCTAARR